MAQLQRLLLGPHVLFEAETEEMQTQIEEIFNRVVFPLLDDLLKPQIFMRDPRGARDAVTRCCQYILDLLDRFMHINKSDQLAVPDSLKDVVLVMNSANTPTVSGQSEGGVAVNTVDCDERGPDHTLQTGSLLVMAPSEMLLASCCVWLRRERDRGCTCAFIYFLFIFTFSLINAVLYEESVTTYYLITPSFLAQRAPSRAGDDEDDVVMSLSGSCLRGANNQISAPYGKYPYRTSKIPGPESTTDLPVHDLAFSETANPLLPPAFSRNQSSRSQDIAYPPTPNTQSRAGSYATQPKHKSIDRPGTGSTLVTLPPPHSPTGLPQTNSPPMSPSTSGPGPSMSCLGGSGAEPLASSSQIHLQSPSQLEAQTQTQMVSDAHIALVDDPVPSAYAYMPPEGEPEGSEDVGSWSARADGVLLLATTMEPTKRLGSEAEVKTWLDGIVAIYAQRAGISLLSGAAGGGGGGGGGGAVINSEEFLKF
ncbi:hypothetical protein HMN09_00645000 [Mycena chlorophos]|uniref:Fatty acid synthase subunit alpha acyl carrier domain-containing protein n=1 Tax=Mycena chlorophos TaxID=658473 RepID=A0A8H6T4T4_MYCCL|nr:hypothetical protein HMN09_00645000 [Mycena chlorophos]